MNARPDNARNRELAQIHIAKKQLALDDDTYRDMLWSIARVRSAGDLDFTGRKRVLEHLRNRGFKTRSGKIPRPGRPANIGHPDRGPSLKKIEALLADSGRAWAYADGMAKKMFHVEKVSWCEVDQLHSIIAALVYDQRRRAAKSREMTESHA